MTMISSLQWPQQLATGPAAWKQCQNFISWNYLQPNSMLLMQPLGPWLPTYNKDFSLEVVGMPKSLYSFYQLDGQWLAFSPVQKYNTHIVTHATPVQPLSQLEWSQLLQFYSPTKSTCLSLPLSPLTTPVYFCLASFSYKDDHTARGVAPAPVAWYLSSCAKQYSPNGTFTNTYIHLVSAAAVHPNGTGIPCAWLSEVLSGEGYIASQCCSGYVLWPCWGLLVINHLAIHPSLYDSVPADMPKPANVPSMFIVITAGLLTEFKPLPSALIPGMLFEMITQFMQRFRCNCKLCLQSGLSSTISRAIKRKQPTKSWHYLRDWTSVAILMLPTCHPFLLNPQFVPTPSHQLATCTYASRTSVSSSAYSTPCAMQLPSNHTLITCLMQWMEQSSSAHHTLAHYLTDVDAIQSS